MAFGELVPRVYDVSGERKARGIARLAFKVPLIEFRGRQNAGLS